MNFVANGGCSLAMHHSLPKIISDDEIDDPTEWILDHPHLPTPGDSLFGPWVPYARLTKLFSDMLAGMNGSHANARSLQWLEMEFQRWRTKWLEKSRE